MSLNLIFTFHEYYLPFSTKMSINERNIFKVCSEWPTLKRNHQWNEIMGHFVKAIIRLENYASIGKGTIFISFFLERRQAMSKTISHCHKPKLPDETHLHRHSLIPCSNSLLQSYNITEFCLISV